MQPVVFTLKKQKPPRSQLTGQGWSGWGGSSKKVSFRKTGQPFLSYHRSNKQRPFAKPQRLRWDQRWRLCHGNGPGVRRLQVCHSSSLGNSPSLNLIHQPPVVLCGSSDKWRCQWATSWWSVRSATTSTTRTVTNLKWQTKMWMTPDWCGTVPAAPGRWSVWWEPHIPAQLSPFAHWLIYLSRLCHVVFSRHRNHHRSRLLCLHRQRQS